jgi:hypothetical protein
MQRQQHLCQVLLHARICNAAGNQLVQMQSWRRITSRRLHMLQPAVAVNKR